MIRCAPIAIVSFLTFLVAAMLPGLARAQTQRNILMIILDDVGVDMIRSYEAGEGSNMVPYTPTIDGLAQEGILFRNAWSNPVCATTRATIQTGRYGHRTTILGASGILPTNELGIAEVLNVHNELNYTQSTYGKWGLHGLGRPADAFTSENAIKHAVRTGYDFFAGTSHSSIASYFNYEKTTAKFMPGTPGSLCDPSDPATHLDNSCIDWTPSTVIENYATTENVDDTVHWIQNDVPAGENWFVVLSFNAAHVPFHAPPGDSLEDPARLWNDFDPNPHANASTRVCKSEISDRQICYRAAIEAADTEIGRLLVEAEIDLSNTTIIVLGDNGSVRDMAVGPFDPLRAKFSLYEGGINVPLIIAGDSVNYPNRESAALVNTSDLFTTVFELAGGDPSVLPVPRHGSPDHDSFSLVPILSDDCNGGCSVESIREYAYAEIVWQMDNGKAIRNRAGYKLKYDGAALPKKWELFYLDDDPFEETDLVVSYNPTTGELLTSPELQPILDDLLAKVGAGGEPPDFPAANLDQDADATADASDNCSVDSNPNQDDSDGDLCGNQCDADYNQDNVVSILDFGTFASCFNGPVQGICDHAPETLDGVVSILDFGVFRQQYTAGVPGPGQSTLCDGQ